MLRTAKPIGLFEGCQARSPLSLMVLKIVQRRRDGLVVPGGELHAIGEQMDNARSRCVGIGHADGLGKALQAVENPAMKDILHARFQLFRYASEILSFHLLIDSPSTSRLFSVTPIATRQPCRAPGRCIFMRTASKETRA